jgi:DNA-3-methyladenine glycosylase
VRRGSTTGAGPAPARGATLAEDFFARPPREVAQDLIGCGLYHEGVGGIIVETEAYERDDPACHAYVGRTARSAVLFGPPARAYVYLCYGIHRMFNVVTDEDGIAAAVLVRAVEPTEGLAAMRERRGERIGLDGLCSGPGKICEALGIDLHQTHSSVLDPPFEMTSRVAGDDPDIVPGPRIGITKGVDLPWRYCLAGSRFLSRPAG